MFSNIFFNGFFLCCVRMAALEAGDTAQWREIQLLLECFAIENFCRMADGCALFQKIL